jgi:hypothetical protein
MRMRRVLLLVATNLYVSLPVIPQTPPKTAPALEFIEAWLTTTTAGEDSKTFDRFVNNGDWGLSTSTTVSAPSFSACNATQAIVVADKSVALKAGTPVDPPTRVEQTFTFSLKNLLPSKIAQGSLDPRNFFFSSTGPLYSSGYDSTPYPAVILQAVGEDIQRQENGGSPNNQATLVIPVQSIDLAARMAHAWHDAAVACGAKDVDPHLY